MPALIVRSAEIKLSRPAEENQKNSARTSAVYYGGILILNKSNGKRYIRLNVFPVAGTLPPTATPRAVIVRTHDIAPTVSEIIRLTAGQRYEQG
jgi:hypothetical protein